MPHHHHHQQQQQQPYLHRQDDRYSSQYQSLPFTASGPHQNYALPQQQCQNSMQQGQYNQSFQRQGCESQQPASYTCSTGFQQPLPSNYKAAHCTAPFATEGVYISFVHCGF
jgi:hypothetical protein